MERALWVGVGGFVGTLLRYGLGGLVGRWKAGWTFPIETLVINVSGCVILGVLAALSDARGVLNGTTRAFVFIGILGGFTTYSTFGYETFQLLRDGQWGSAGLSAGLQLVLGVGGVAAGYALAGFVR